MTEPYLSQYRQIFRKIIPFHVTIIPIFYIPHWLYSISPMRSKYNQKLGERLRKTK